MKKQKGITLVSLVITIIVLLILVGVLISLFVGNNGILKRTKDANIVREKATAQQEVELSISDAQMAYYTESILNSSVGKAKFLGTPSYYINNCKSSDKDGIMLTRGSGVDDNSNSGEITVKYKAKSGNYYTFVFDLANPEEFKSITGPTDS